jgi:hypothetical protein
MNDLLWVRLNGKVHRATVTDSTLSQSRYKTLCGLVLCEPYVYRNDPRQHMYWMERCARCSKIIRNQLEKEGSRDE